VRVTKNFNIGLWMRNTQGLERRQCQDEIAKRAAADDEDWFNNG
jgi:hypothetical protein